VYDRRAEALMSDKHRSVAPRDASMAPERTSTRASSTGFFEDYLERAGAQVPERRKRAQVKLLFPSTCSIFDDPESALAITTKIAQAVVSGATKLWFDQELSVQVDLCAEALTAAFAKQARLACVDVNGEYPKELDARSCVAGFGTPAVLKEFAYEPTWEIPLILLERHDSAEKIGTGLLPLEERASNAERIPVLIEEQFGNRAMTLQFGDRLIQFLLAAIENAVEHGDGEWWIASSFRKLQDPNWGKCQIVIFNIGDTIHQTMQRLPSDSVLRRNGDSYVEAQRKSFGTNWSEEGVWTLFALQNEVTNRPDAGVIKKGKGFLSMLRFLDAAVKGAPASHAPRMCVLSGNTHLLLDSRYLYDESNPERTPSAVALNKANDLRYPPSPAAARTLRRFFPGTLIAVQFYVTPNAHFNPSLVSHERSYEERRSGPSQAYAVSGPGLRRRRVG
jgi:hypothetical protein